VYCGVDQMNARALGEPYVVALRVDDEYGVTCVDPPFGKQPGQVALADPCPPGDQQASLGTGD
jgi:hypothetical protein